LWREALEQAAFNRFRSWSWKVRYLHQIKDEKNHNAVIIEFKAPTINSKKESVITGLLKSAAKEALEQTLSNKYYADMKGCKSIILVGVAIYHKHVWVEHMILCGQPIQNS